MAAPTVDDEILAILAERKRPGELSHEAISAGEWVPEDPRNWVVEEHPDEKALFPHRFRHKTFMKTT
jgi:hypothetical protein